MMTGNSGAPLRAAIYARMSTDKQSADSPADQIARCRDFAASRGWTVAADLVVEDAGVSGASRHNRPKLLTPRGSGADSNGRKASGSAAMR